MGFPKSFVWGAASASYQVEGGGAESGRGLCVWDAFCRQPKKIKNNESGAVACDHYTHYESDVQLMGDIGLNAYRLSLSWPRILPEGVGKINEPGIDFYDRLVDCLLDKNIEPWITLFHWDFPYALFLKGGWLNPDSPNWFSEYTQIVVERLSDRVSHWMTLNEPQCFLGFGHHWGDHAPGLKLGFPEVLLASHHALVAHGNSARVIREQSQKKPQIGAAPVGIIHLPLTDSEADVALAREKTFGISQNDVWNNTWFADPMVLGSYPEDGLNLFGHFLPKGFEKDLATINQPLDFYGVNMYNGFTISSKNPNKSELMPSKRLGFTMMDWPITPEILYWGPKFLYERYKLPLVITENGMANCDWIQMDGKINDPQRIDYIQRHLIHCQKAISEEIPINGYFYWSIMDNFEWAEGYRKRFGLIYVDYDTQKRYLKESAHWYTKVIVSNGSVLEKAKD